MYSRNSANVVIRDACNNIDSHVLTKEYVSLFFLNNLWIHTFARGFNTDVRPGLPAHPGNRTPQLQLAYGLPLFAFVICSLIVYHT